MSLLTIAQQQAIKPISPNWAAKVKITGGVTNFDQLEQEIEESKLSDLLGIALFQDVQDNPTTAPNLILLDGGSFTDCNSNVVKFKGLRFIIAYMVYPDYIDISNYDDTYTGMVQKNRQETTTISTGDKKRMRDRTIEIALNEFALIKDFLNENSKDYPLWICTESKSVYKPKFTSIRKTIR